MRVRDRLRRDPRFGGDLEQQAFVGGGVVEDSRQEARLPRGAADRRWVESRDGEKPRTNRSGDEMMQFNTSSAIVSGSGRCKLSRRRG